MSPTPRYELNGSAMSVSDLASCTHEAGGPNASEDILTVDVRGASGVQVAPSKRTAAEERSYELHFSVYERHDTWLLSVPVLQRLGFGFYFVSTGTGDAAWVQNPEGRGYPMRKTARPCLWAMPCHSPRPGVLMYGVAPAGSVSVPVEVDLYPDSAATINVAGKGWREILVLDDRAATSAMGAGNNTLSGIGHGRADLFFPASAQLVSRRAADFPGGALGSSGGAHVKLAVHADLECSRLPEEHALLLEGPLLRVGDTPTTNGRPLGSHADAEIPRGCAPTIFGIFGTYPIPLSHAPPSTSGGPYGLMVGDIIDVGEARGGRQRVTDVRARIAQRGLRTDDIPIISTVWERDGSFASDGPADVLMSVGEGGTRLWRGDRELTGALPTSSAGG